MCKHVELDCSSSSNVNQGSLRLTHTGSSTELIIAFLMILIIIIMLGFGEQARFYEQITVVTV